MIFGNAAWGFRETPLEEQLRITRDMGLSILELGIANAPADLPLTVSLSDIAKIRNTAGRYDVKLLCAATGNDFTKGTANIDKLKRVIDICGELEVRYLRVFTGFSALRDVTEDRYQVMLQALCEAADYAGKKGVIPALETHGGVRAVEGGVEHFSSTSTDRASLKRILDSVPGNVTLCFDPANLYAVGYARPEEIFLEFQDRVAYAHFKDFVRTDAGALKPSRCGQSDMNWACILDAMKHFNGPVLFEYENAYDVEAGLRKSYQYILERIKENE